ncbi:MAG: hypothetical protein C4K49_08470 [Candidatus Thorarchaeota archaeon]|nr:MAG: hypothetical protein C4K49_08470 [Candidatus Thorarchaeota archaeon]
MSVRAFPETHREPRKRILLVPVVLILVGMLLVYMHPWFSTGFIGAVISLAGVLSIFLVGMVFADLWAASRRTKDIIKARQARSSSAKADATGQDPFEEEVGREED